MSREDNVTPEKFSEVFEKENGKMTDNAISVGAVCPMVTTREREHYERLAADAARRLGRYRAEIVPGSKPAWHIVLTVPGQEGTASAHLVARGFGVYVPKVTKKTSPKNGGRSHQRRDSIYRNYILVFCWDVAEHWRRITACPGVTGVKMEGGAPAVIADDEIYKMQRIEFREGEFTLEDYRKAVFGVVQRPRRRKRGKMDEVLDADDKDYVERGDAVITCRSY